MWEDPSRAVDGGGPGFDIIMVPLLQHLQQHLCNRRNPVERVATQRFFVVHDVVAGRRLGGAAMLFVK